MVFGANREELLLLMLQEALQSDYNKMSLNMYTVLHKGSRRDSTSGGVPCFLVKVFYPVLSIWIQFAGCCCQNLHQENSDSLQHIFTTIGAH